MTAIDEQHTFDNVPVACSPVIGPTTLALEQGSTRKRQRRLTALASTRVPASLEEKPCDPDGTLEKLGILSAKDFWHWYHIEDGPKGTGPGHMGQKWGEYWLEFLQSDTLVLAGAVPLVLQKRAQITGVSETQRLKLAEFKALQRLRQRLECLDMDSIGGLVMAICGRVHMNIQQCEPELALMHLQAIGRLVAMQPPIGTVWICTVFTDLRIASSTGLHPVLERYISPDWKRRAPALPSECIQASHRSAMANMHSLSLAGSMRFSRIYPIFKQLHELEILTKLPADLDQPPIVMLYNTIYDCCILDTEASLSPRSHPLATQTSLLAICLKLCAWEQASRYIPRGGEIERHLLKIAKRSLVDDNEWLHTFATTPGGASASTVTWIFFALTATAYMFQRDELGAWIARLRGVTPLKTASALLKSLKGWPCAEWWLSHALRRICSELAPKKRQWRILMEEPDPVPVFSTGLRLKLLVIAD